MPSSARGWHYRARSFGLTVIRNYGNRAKYDTIPAGRWRRARTSEPTRRTEAWTRREVQSNDCQGARPMKLLVATQNPGKKREYRELLASLEAEIRFPDDLGLHLDVREDGTTYAQNARKKAERYARASGLLTLADDSGLEVDALEGAPGIHSARYAAGTDADRVEALLDELRGVPWDDRTARFRCVLVIVLPADDDVYQVEGICEGVIAREPRGEHGFGYDPVFYLPEHGSTMAELPEEEKNRISHRARAVQSALPLLGRLVDR